MDSEIVKDDIFYFKIYERYIIKTIDNFIASLNLELNLIEKKKSNIYKFYDEMNNLGFVHGSFNIYSYDDCDFILTNNLSLCFFDKLNSVTP